MSMMEFNMSAPIEIPHNRTKASYVLTVVSVLSLSLGAYNIYAVNNNPTKGSVICEQRNGDTNEVIHDEIDANFNSEFASKAGMIARLENLYGDLQHEGWDGYGSAPLEESSYNNTKKLLELLSGSQLSFWNLFPSPNGTFLLSAKSGIASINIGNKEFSYAAMKGEIRLMGKEAFDADQAAKVVEHIHSIFRYG